MSIEELCRRMKKTYRMRVSEKGEGGEEWSVCSKNIIDLCENVPQVSKNKTKRNSKQTKT